MGSEPDPLLFLRLGSTDDERQRAYQQLIAEALDPQDTADLRARIQQQRGWGTQVRHLIA